MRLRARLTAGLLLAGLGTSPLPAQQATPVPSPSDVAPGNAPTIDTPAAAPAVDSPGATQSVPVAPARKLTGTERMNEMNARLQRVERVLDNQVLLEMLRSLDQMQAEVRELRGEIERQTYELDVLKQRQRDLYLDSDRRLRDLELGATARAPQAEPTESPPPIPPVPVVETPAASAPEPAPADEPVTAEAEQAAPPADPELERPTYTAAFDQLKAGRYQPAINAFKDFLAKYPDGRYAANAQYWLGEANYVSRNFSDALEQFRQVLARYPASPKVADARLKIGYTHYELEEWEDAKRVLEELVRDYPNSSVARLAQQRIIRMKNEGH